MNNFTDDHKNEGSFEKHDVLHHLIKRLASRQKPVAEIICPDKFAQIQEATNLLRNQLKKHHVDGTAVMNFDTDFFFGAVTAEIVDSAEFDPQQLAAIIALADNVEIYTLVNGHFRLELTFHHALEPIY